MFGKLRFRFWSIGAKTLVSHLVLALTVTLSVCLLACALQLAYVRDMLINELMARARSIAAMTEVHEGGFALPKPESIRAYQELINAMVLYVHGNSVENRGGDAVHTGIAMPKEGDVFVRVEFDEQLDKEVVARVLRGQEFSAMRKMQFADGVMLLVGVPICEKNGDTVGGVIVAQPISVFRNLSGMMRVLVYFAAGAAIFLAAILAMLLSNVLTRPIRRITQTARCMAEGQYAARMQVSGADEIGELGTVLNTLCARLSGSIERLREEKDKLELIIASIGEGILAVDSQKKALHVNRAFLELMETNSASEALRNESAIGALLGETMEKGKRCEARLVNPSGRNLLAAASPFFDEENHIVGAVALLRDVSQEERLEQLRRDYVANVSHELRTPLTGIRGMVEPLMDGYIETDEERQDCYRVIYQETLRLEKLVGEMLDMSRLQDGRAAVETEMLELPGIIQAAARRMQPLAEKCGVCLSWETDGTALACMGNENRILQVLVIFLDNALSFTPEGGSVCVFGRDGGDCVIAGVQDTGVGIEPKDLPFIWERFYKADKSRLRTTGTGLGLAIAKLVVELMGGEIGVQSQLGQGSRFFFSLPKQK